MSFYNKTFAIVIDINIMFFAMGIKSITFISRDFNKFFPFHGTSLAKLGITKV